MLEGLKQIPEGSALILLPYDTSDGLAKLDWKGHAYDSNYFMQLAHIFETREPENVDLFFGRETPKNKDFIKNFLQTMGGKPKPVVSGSDAHKVADYGRFPSNRITWIKTKSLLMLRLPRGYELSFLGPFISPKVKQGPQILFPAWLPSWP